MSAPPSAENEAGSSPVGGAERRGARPASALGAGGGEGSRPAVCLFTDSGEPSGVGEHMLTLGAALRDLGCRVWFACPPSAQGRGFLERAAAAGLGPTGLDPLWGEAERRRFQGWLRDRRPDVLHAHAGIGWEGTGAPAAARAAGVPVVVRTEHLPYLIADPWQRAAHADMLAAVDRLVCVSEGARASHLAAGVPPGLVAVVRNGIAARPTPRASREASRERLGVGEGSPLLLTVARLAEQKGHLALLDAVPAVLDAAPGARFAWVGTGPLEGPLRAEVRARGLDGAVALLGRRDDVPDLLAAADAFVLPSRFEGLPLAVLEAMAAGLPVVATRVCGTDEAVSEGLTGLLVPPDDPAALAAALRRLVARPAWARRLGAAGRERVAREFGAGRMAGETLALYEALLARRAPPRPARSPTVVEA